MPSDFDNIFGALGRPVLLSAFAADITIEVEDGHGYTVAGGTAYKTWEGIKAQIGREIIRRVRTNDGVSMVRSRDVLISADDPPFSEFESENIETLKTFRKVKIDWIEYAVTGAVRAPGRMIRLTLERSDPSRISRPNLGGRR